MVVSDDPLGGVTVDLTATASLVEGNDITYTATLTGGTAGNDITVTLANGETITIEAGQTSGSTTTATRVDEEYIQGTATITNSITNVVETSSDAAPKLESVAAAADTSVSTSVTDDADVSTVTLSSSDVNEGEAITVTATVDNAPQTTDLVLTLNNGETITIVAGATQGSVTFANPNGADNAVDGETLTYSITGSSGGNYESLDTSDTVDVVVTDPLSATVSGDISTQDAEVLANTADSGSAQVTGSGGSGGYSYAFAAGATTSVAAGDFSIDAAGLVTFTQDAAYSHAVGSDLADNAYSIDVVITDSDGNSVTRTVNVDITDDMPSISPTSFGTLQDGSSTSSVSLGQAFGADLAGDVDFGSVALGFSALDEVAVTSGGSQVYFDGGALTWSLSEPGDVLTAETASGTVAITVTINQGVGSYSVEAADGTFYLQGDDQSFSLNSLSGSNADAWALQTTGTGDVDVFITSLSADGSTATTTNTNSAGGQGYVGAGSNWVDSGTSESITLQFISGMTASGGLAGQSAIDSALSGTAVAGVNVFSIAVNTGNGGTATTIRVNVTSVGGVAGYVDVPVQSNGTSSPDVVTIDTQNVNWDSGTNLAIATATFTANAASGVDFRLGGSISFTEIKPSDVPLDLPVTITDGDQDIAQGAITGTITSTGVAPQAFTVASPNEAPTASDAVMQVDEDSMGQAVPALAGTDSDGQIAGFRIATLPANGTLLLNGVAVAVDDVIDAADAGSLVYTTGPEHWSGSASFEYVAVDNDGAESAVPATMSITVNPVADTPNVSILATSATSTTGARVESGGINITVGDAVGDGDIAGNANYEYDESETTTIDFGAAYAGQTVTVELNVTVSGSWNYDGASTTYRDDFWELRVNGTPDARFFYNANASGSGQATNDSDQLLGGGDNIRFAGTSTTNDDFSGGFFSHTYSTEVTLDASGRAVLGFAAATTQTTETATITGAAVTNLTEYTYQFDIAASLVDTDGSEQMSLLITGVPSGSSFVSLTSSQGYTLSNNGDGTYTLSGFAAGALSVTDTLTLKLASPTAPNFELGVQATSTEQANSDTADNSATVLSSTIAVTDLGGSGDSGDSGGSGGGTGGSTAIAAGTELFKDTFENDSADGWTNDSEDDNELEIASGSTSSKTFSFGQENAGKSVTVSFSAETKENWGGNDSVSVTDGAGNSLYSHSNDLEEAVTFVATTDASGNLVVNIAVNTNDNDETLEVDNFTIEAGSNMVQTTELGYAPIAIDLDGDGVEYLSREAGVVFTDQTTGESVNTAWVAPDDGMLVIDANNSGTVDESREYVFTEWSETAETDMEAVAEVFDTNQDGVLDAQDEQWDQFAVWQDSDSDGVTDEGELVSLTELGVESIALTYSDDSESGTAADGDVIIHGQSEVVFTDGATTTAEDTTFAISAADVISDEGDLALPASEEAARVPGAPDAEADGRSGEFDTLMIEADLMLNANRDEGVDDSSNQ